MSPSSRFTTSAASSSCRSETGANTETIATPSAFPAIEPRNLAASSASNGERSRPSNSIPPPTIASPAEIACRRSSGHPDSGGTANVAGAPNRRTATRRRSRRCNTAFVAWVVPSMTWVIRARSNSPAATTPSIAPRIPPVTSGVVGTFAVASRRSSRSRTTASVCAPPTSIPRRRSTATELLHRNVVEVVPEGPRARELEAGGRSPDRIAREGDDRDPLAVPHALGLDRIAGLGVDHRDDVRDHRVHLLALQRDQVLVLDLQADRAASVLPETLDRHLPTDESLRGPALHVDHLAHDQHRPVDGLGQRGHRVVLGLPDHPPAPHP